MLDGLTLDDRRRATSSRLMGPSGSGKTTLLNLIGGIDQPTSGDVVVGGTDIATLKRPRRWRKWRSRNIGFIFQLYNLIPVLTALQNVELPLLLVKMSGKERKERARNALELVGLGDRLTHYPAPALGRPGAARRDRARRGERSRGAARRRAHRRPRPQVGRGDPRRCSSGSTSEFKKTIVMVTHDPHAAERANRVLHLDKGVLQQREEAAMNLLSLVLVNLGRNKRRTILTLLSVMVALFLFCTLRRRARHARRVDQGRQRDAARHPQRDLADLPAAARLSRAHRRGARREAA